MTSAAELDRVVEFRNRLVAYANLVRENVIRFVPTPDHKQQRIGEESAWLAQEYGRVYKLILPYGIAQMTQFGRIASTDAVRDTIGSPGHPEYTAMAGMAIQHLDMVIGRMRAEVEDRAGKSVDPEALYRLTSPVYWLGRLAALIHWLVTTKGGRIVALVGTFVGIVVGGIASGLAQGWYEQITK